MIRFILIGTLIVAIVGIFLSFKSKNLGSLGWNASIVVIIWIILIRKPKKKT